MKITAIKTHIVGEGRNFFFVTVETDAGITGIGEGGISWRELLLRSNCRNESVFSNFANGPSGRGCCA